MDFKVNMPKINLSNFDNKPIVKDSKRSLSIRDKQIVWARAHKKCEFCGKRLDFGSMQIGHKKAYSRGGKTTIKNAVCLCYEHNKMQGTDSWKTFLRKMGKSKKPKPRKPHTRKPKKKEKSLFPDWQLPR